MSSEKKTDFAVLITFDSNVKHSEITELLNNSGIYKKSLSNNELPNNTYVGVIEGVVTLNDKKSYDVKDLRITSEKIANSLRAKLRNFFNENDITGKVYVLVSWYPVTDDSVTR